MFRRKGASGRQLRREQREQRRRERNLERALRFRQCPFCEFDIATGEGWRGCHYYDCPYLPEELNVRCPVCQYNFYTGEGTPHCGDPPTCEFALEEAPRRVAALRRWLAENTTSPRA